MSSRRCRKKSRSKRPLCVLEGFSKTFLDPLDKLGAKTKIAFCGNHSQWLYDATAAHPEFGKSLDPEKQLHLAERGWEWIPYKKFWTAPGGKLVFNHGDLRTSRNRAGLTKHHAFDMVSRTHACIRYGHAHTLMISTIPNQLEPDRPLNGFSVPCGCRTDLPYLENSATNWVQGFYLGWIREDGTFNDYAIVVVDSRATFAGKTYEGKTK